MNCPSMNCPSAGLNKNFLILTPYKVDREFHLAGEVGLIETRAAQLDVVCITLQHSELEYSILCILFDNGTRIIYFYCS